MAFTDEMLIKLDREEVLSLDKKTRLRWYKLLQVKHRELLKVTEDLTLLMNPYIDVRMVALVGMTGIGKTTMAKRILNQVLVKSWGDDVRASDIPYIFIPAPANGEKSFSWRALYSRTLKAANEILIAGKRQFESDGKTVKLAGGGDTVAALRESLETVLTERNVRLLVIDEAAHLLRFEGYTAVMDTLKSLGDIQNTKILLLGSYDLFDLMTDYGQTARRGEILHYRRYIKDPKNLDDLKEFTNSLIKLQAKWPCSAVPNFVAIADELMEATLGSVGMLKSLLLMALAMQLRESNEQWRPQFLAKSAKSLKLTKKIREETEAGEKRIIGAEFGESMFSDLSFLARVAEKMAGHHALG